MMSEYSSRDKAIIIGLYLSKFDSHGLDELGFNGFFNAYNVIGYTLGVEPLSIRGYRDEFDPYFPNKRKGWHKRPLRQYLSEMMASFSNLHFTEFTDLVKSFILPNYNIEKVLPNASKAADVSESVAKRLATGVAAEEYFKANYTVIPEFSGYDLQDTRMMACGFDFRLTSLSAFYYVEVKGINLKNGSIALTEKEYFVASEFREKYCIFVVRNFIEKPIHEIFFNPLASSLELIRKERHIVQVSYSASI